MSIEPRIEAAFSSHFRQFERIRTAAGIDTSEICAGMNAAADAIPDLPPIATLRNGWMPDSYPDALMLAQFVEYLAIMLLNDGNSEVVGRGREELKAQASYVYRSLLRDLRLFERGFFDYANTTVEAEWTHYQASRETRERLDNAEPWTNGPI